MRSSPVQSSKISVSPEEAAEVLDLVLDIRVADARLRRLTSRRDEIISGWQQQHKILAWDGWQIDLEAGTLTPPGMMPQVDNGNAG